MRIFLFAMLMAFLTACSSESQNAQETTPAPALQTVTEDVAAEAVAVSEEVIDDDTVVEETIVEETVQLEFDETQFSDWFRVCAKNMPDLPCQVVQVMEMDNEQGKTRLLESVLMRANEDVIVLQMVLPLGVDIRPGIALQIGQEAEFTQPYLTCVPAGCLTVMEVTPERMQQLKSNDVMKLGFRPANTDQTIVLDVSLRGFTEAVEGF